MRDLKPGDVVHVQGIVCEMAEIAWQNFDGGYAELKGE